ncbi:MAG: class I SAM-dependent methyltransferase [Micromonosporaceae bacterium]
MPQSSERDDQLRRWWDKQAHKYDAGMAFFDRRLFGDTRDWICEAAAGDVLEVAIGTGLNLAHYPADVNLTGVEWSDAMLALARRRSAELGRKVDLRHGDAQRLEFPDASFDTVVCTYGLCAIPDEKQALAEMTRVLRPGGLLLLADHVESSLWPVRALQGLMELITVPMGGEHFRRRPSRQVRDLGYAIERRDRFKLGIVERIAARKPLTGSQQPTDL